VRERALLGYGASAEWSKELSRRAKWMDSSLSSRAMPLWRPAACRRGSALHSARTTRPGGSNREVACHYTFMHENLFDMNHQFMHRKQMGSIRAHCIGRQHGENWAQVEYSFSRTAGKSSVGEQVIVDLMRKRGEAKKPSPITCAFVPTTPPRI